MGHAKRPVTAALHSHDSLSYSLLVLGCTCSLLLIILELALGIPARISLGCHRVGQHLHVGEEGGDTLVLPD